MKCCGNCGKEMKPDAKFCAACGSKLETEINENAKQLTNAVINKDLRNAKHSFWEYIGQMLLVGLIFLVYYLGRPIILIFLIPCALNVLRMIRSDIRKSKLKYYVLERNCIEKKFVENDEAPNQWQLWFENKDRSLYVAIDVTTEFYDETKVDEAFYIVFLKQEKVPCLCYRKSEWQR